MPHPPQELPYRCDEYGDFVLSVGRLDRAKRVDLLLEALAVGPSLRCVIAGDGPDRERLEGLVRRHGLDGRVVFAGRVSEDELTDLYARCLAVYYAPVDEDFGMVPYEAFLSEKPVVTTTDAGGPLEVVPDRRTGLVCEPCGRVAGRRVRVARRESRRARATWGRAGRRDRRAAHLGPRDRAAARVKVAYYSPLPPSRSGVADYSALLLPALERRIDVTVVPRGGRAGAAAPVAMPTSALYHVGNDPERHGWIVEALRRRPGVVVLHDFVLHHLVAGITLGRGDADGYLDAMRARGRRGRADARPTAWSTACCRRSGRRRAHEFPLDGRGALVSRPA